MQHPDPETMNAAIDIGVEHNGVGAIMISNGNRITTSHGAVTSRPDATAHAEIEVIRNACRQLETHHLTNGWLYTTHSPCPMCMAASCWARLEGVVYAARTADMPADWATMFETLPPEEIRKQAAHQPQLIKEFRRKSALRIHKVNSN